MTTENKYAKWLSLSKRLKTVKEKEMKMRKELCVEIFEGRQGKEKKKFVSGSYNVVADNKISYKLDVESLKAMWEELTDVEINSIKWVPELKVTPYKLVTDKNALLHECIIIKPASPTLKVTKIKE